MTNCNNCGAPFNPAGICDHCGTGNLIKFARKQAVRLQEFVFSGRVTASDAKKAAQTARHNIDADLKNQVTEESVKGVVSLIDKLISNVSVEGSRCVDLRYMYGRFKWGEHRDKTPKTDMTIYELKNEHMRKVIIRHYRKAGFKVEDWVVKSDSAIIEPIRTSDVIGVTVSW